MASLGHTNKIHVGPHFMGDIRHGGEVVSHLAHLTRKPGKCLNVICLCSLGALEESQDREYV